MSTQRATWSYTYEKGLVDIMVEQSKIAMFKGQNGWTAEGWRSITNKFSEMFPQASFSKQQIQEKEKELKKSYKIIRQARKSECGWNEALGMIIAEPKIWEKLISENAKVAKFKKKPFPLFSKLELLHEVTSTESPPQRTEPPPQRTEPSPQRIEPPSQRTELHLEPQPQRSNSDQSTHTTAPNSGYNGMGSLGRNPFSSGLDGMESNEVESAPSNHNLEDRYGGSGRKRKQSQIAEKLGDIIEIRKSHIEKAMGKLNEKRRPEDDYSVEKCIDMVDKMDELTDEQKADANELFQSEMNRQIFAKTKNPNVRLIWLTKKISQIQ